MNKIHENADLNLFRVFVTIAEEGSTNGAANRLHVSQSAISHALRRLRDLLGDPVFVKHGRRLVLTPHGRNILPVVKAALNSLATCTSREGVFEPENAELEFHLGFRDILEFLTLPNLLQDLRNLEGHPKFASRPVTSGQIEELLLSGELDLIIDIEHFVAEKIASMELTREYLVVLVGSKHSAYSQKQLDLSQFIESDHVLVTLEAKERALVDQRTGDIGKRRNIVLHCQSYVGAARVVEQTDLLLTMPFSYAAYLAQYLDVKIHAVPFPFAPIPIRLYWRKDLSSEPYMKWLLEKMPEALRKSLPEYCL